MSDQRKTKAQLVEEVASLRQRLAECGAAGGSGSETQGEQQLRAGVAKRKLVEASLLHGQLDYQTLFEAVIDGIVVIDAETWRIVHASDRAAQIYGFESVDDLCSLGLLDYIHPEDRDTARASLAEAILGKGLRQLHQFRTLTRYGQEIWIEAVGSIIEYRGRPGILASFRDITERKRAEEEARRQAERAEALHAVSATVSHTLDLDQMLSSVLATVVDLVGADAGYIHLFDWESVQLVLKAHQGISQAYAAALERLTVSEQGIERWSQYPEPAFRTPHILEDTDHVLSRRAATDDGLSFESFVAIPIWSRGELHGGLSLVCQSPRRYADDELQLLKAIGNEIAVGVANARLYEQARAATQAMQEERDRAKTYFDSAAVMMLVLDAEGKVESINHRGCQVLGCEENPAVGHNWFDTFVPGGVRGEVRELHRAAFAGESEASQAYGNPVLTRDGSHREILWQNTMLWDWEGKVVAALCCGEDVTDRKRAEEALRSSEERYRSLVENAQEGIWAIDKDACTTFVNPRMAQMLGYTEEEMLGRHLFSFMDEAGAELCRHYLERREQGVSEQHDFAFQRSDGTNLYASVETGPLTDSKGCYTGALACVADITERREMEEAVRASEEKYRSLVDGMLDGYVVVRGNRILFANKVIADSLGVRPENLVGTSFLPILAPESREASRAINKSTRRGEAPPDLAELTLVTQDGATVPVEVRIREIDYEGQRAYSVLLRDITERKAGEEALRSLQRRLRSLASRLAVVEERERRRLAEQVHDRIGQTLAILKLKLGELRLALEDAGLKGQFDDLRQLLDQALEDTRSVTFELSPPILHELGLEAALEWLADQVEEHYHLRCRFSDDGRSKPLGDDTRAFLFRAAHELLMNVVRHAQARQVKFSACRRENVIRVTVEDDGTGFDAAKAESKTSGFGLFSIDQRLTELGGHVEIQSKRGKGTRVTLVVPLECTD